MVHLCIYICFGNLLYELPADPWLREYNLNQTVGLIFDIVHFEQSFGRPNLS